MDFWKAVQELYLERERINKAIATLEAFQRLAAKPVKKTAKRAKKKAARSAKA